MKSRLGRAATFDTVSSLLQRGLVVRHRQACEAKCLHGKDVRLKTKVAAEPLLGLFSVEFENIAALPPKQTTCPSALA